MIRIACAGRHGVQDGLCAGCEELLGYTIDRLDRCAFQANKPTCAECSIHCYRPDMREKIRSVMRYAGPRMIVQRPLLALGHLIDRLRERSAVVAARESGTQDLQEGLS